MSQTPEKVRPTWRRFMSRYFWNRSLPLTWGLVVRARQDIVMPVDLMQIIGGKSWSLSLMRLGDPRPLDKWREQRTWDEASNG